MIAGWRRAGCFVMLLAGSAVLGFGGGPHAPDSTMGAPCCEPLIPPTPLVSIHVFAPACGGPDREIEYRIRVENNSPAPAHQVAVRNTLPANARFVRSTPEPSTRDPEMVWQLGTLTPGACREIWLVLLPSGPGDVKNCVRVQFEHGQCVCTKIGPPGVPAALGLQLRKEGPNQAALNDSIRFRLTVTNTGQTEAAGIVITDSLPAGLEHESRKNSLTWDMGDLAPGQSRSVDYQVVARQPGRLCNAAVATAGGGLRHEVEHCVMIGDARLSLTKTGPPRRYLNMPAEYRISVTNSGTLPLTNIQVSDSVPPETTFAGSKSGQLVGNEVRWNIAALEPGATQTVDVGLRARQPGTIKNRATAIAGNIKVDAEASTEFFGASALLLELVDTDDPVEVGGTTRFVILLRNQGSAPATDIRLTAQIPPEIQVTQIAGPAQHKTEGQTLTFDAITLQPQAEMRLVIHAKALKAGDVRFKIELAAKDLSNGPIQEEESTTIYSDLSTLPQNPPDPGR